MYEMYRFTYRYLELIPRYITTSGSETVSRLTSNPRDCMSRHRRGSLASRYAVKKSFSFFPLLLILMVFLTVTPSYCQDTQSADTIPTLDERIRTFIQESFFQSLGIVSSVIVSDDYDTGMGFGGNVSQTLIDRYPGELPVLKLRTTIYFWGASKDSNDVSTLGIEESLLLEKSPHANYDIFTGLTAGYYSIEKATLYRFETDEYTDIANTNTFNIYLTSGFRYHYRTDRSFTCSLNYLITKETSELHIFFGLEFFKLHR